MECLNNYENADTISIDTLALEEILQEERAREISELNSLSKKVSCLHTNLLYYRNSKSELGSACYEIWKVLLKKVGGTPNGCRDFGYCLGIEHDDLDYIVNSVKEDPVDVVLKVFIQNEKATLDKVLDAFVKMKRYDILKAIEGPLTNLAQFFNKDDSGYHSNNNSGTKNIISFTRKFPDLPPALNKQIDVKDKEPNKPNQPILKMPVEKSKVKNDNPILFLTFTEDGLQTALNIQDLVYSWTDIPDVTVITLEDRREEVYQNPEKFIREYFEKADYVVPIITTDYIKEISSHSVSVPSTSDNLDQKYTSFIYSLIVNHYIFASGCLNKKVRSVLPKNVDMNVLRNVTMYPDLLPWTYETNFDKQFKAFLMKEYS